MLEYQTHDKNRQAVSLGGFNYQLACMQCGKASELTTCFDCRGIHLSIDVLPQPASLTSQLVYHELHIDDALLLWPWLKDYPEEVEVYRKWTEGRGYTAKLPSNSSLLAAARDKRPTGNVMLRITTKDAPKVKEEKKYVDPIEALLFGGNDA